jgi:integrase
MRCNPVNARIKHEYLTYLEEGKGLSPESVDAAAAAIARFEDYTERRDFKKFHRQQAIGFKKHLADRCSRRTGERLSKATVYSVLGCLKAFFLWLAGQPGYKSRIQYGDAEYFGLSLKDTAIAKAKREPQVPTVDQIRGVVQVMPNATAIEKRNRAVIAFALLTGARDDAIASMRLKHVNVSEGFVHHDAREVRVKFSKTFPTFFFEVGDDFRRVVVDWVAFLKNELRYGPDDPLFPRTMMGLTETGKLGPIGLLRDNWATAGPIRAIFRNAFTAAGMPYFNPHSVRKTLVRLGMERCKGDPEALKAWSQNLGHTEVLTTFNHYGDLPAQRQRELIRSSIAKTDDDRKALELGRAALAAARATNKGDDWQYGRQ